MNVSSRTHDVRNPLNKSNNKKQLRFLPHCHLSITHSPVMLHYIDKVDLSILKRGCDWTVNVILQTFRIIDHPALAWAMLGGMDCTTFLSIFINNPWTFSTVLRPSPNKKVLKRSKKSMERFFTSDCTFTSNMSKYLKHENLLWKIKWIFYR